MTTTVIIKAYCANSKEVRVTINDNESGVKVEEFVLQDGETAERYAYDGREISVREVTK